MNIPRLLSLSSITLLALAGCAHPGGSESAAADAGDATIIVSPSATQLSSGCWATFYGQRGYRGDSLTLIGPIELQSLDKGSARQLRRSIDSIVTGPHATLTVYDHQLFSNRSVAFAPGSRESSVIERLGFGGRIESLRLECDG